MCIFQSVSIIKLPPPLPAPSVALSWYRTLSCDLPVHTPHPHTPSPLIGWPIHFDGVAHKAHMLKSFCRLSSLMHCFVTHQTHQPIRMSQNTTCDVQLGMNPFRGLSDLFTFTVPESKTYNRKINYEPCFRLEVLKAISFFIAVYGKTTFYAVWGFWM